MKQISIKKNFIMNAILTMSSFIFPLITYRYVARVLMPEGTGKVAFATSLISYFLMLAQLGIPTYGIRVCARVRDNKPELTRTAHELLSINLIMSAVSYILLFIGLAVIPRLQSDRTLYIIVSATILLNSLGMEWLYKALEQYSYITIRSLIFKVIAILLMFLLVKKQDDYIIYGAITIFAASASNILNLINAHKYIGFKPVGNYDLKKHLKPVAIFFAMACATTIYTHLDALMLGFMATDADVGYYHTAVRIKTILVSIVTSLGTVLLPRVSYYINNGQMEEFDRITRKALNFVFIIASPLTVYFILFARYGILLLSNDAFLNAVTPMQVIMPTVLLIGLTNIMGIQILVPKGREKVVLYSEIGGAVVDVIINAITIPFIKSTGAALGTLIAEFVVFAIQYRALRDEITGMFKSIHYVNILVGMLLGTLCSLWVMQLHLNSFFTLMISAILFFGIYFGYLLFRRETIVTEIITQLLKKFRKIGGHNNA